MEVTCSFVEAMSPLIQFETLFGYLALRGGLVAKMERMLNGMGRKRLGNVFNPIVPPMVAHKVFFSE